MHGPDIVIVGAGPAGIRAAVTIAAAGIRPIVIDEAPWSGGQIFRRPPAAIGSLDGAIYGFEAAKAKRLHDTFDALGDRIDYRPQTLVWAAEPGRLHLASGAMTSSIAWSHLLIAPGAMDRIIPVEGWTLPGVWTLGGAQIALKAQSVGVGRRVLFFGTGPLLYLVAYQYARAGLEVAAVVDTASPAAGRHGLPGMMRVPSVLAKGLYYMAWLRGHGVSIFRQARPSEILEAGGVAKGLRFADHRGAAHEIAADALAFGFGLRAESQLADLLDLSFRFDPQHRQWLPSSDPDGRSSHPRIYLAGDGAVPRGAAMAELAGERAARALLADIGLPVDRARTSRIAAAMARHDRFRAGLDTAFPFPHQLARAVGDEIMLCRCEGITVGAVRSLAAQGTDEINRVKALSRLGMGRCQGRVCGLAAAEILADACGRPLADVGRLRGQAPIKPVPLSVLAGGRS